MLDNSIETLEKQIKTIEYKDNYLVITLMDNTQKAITYSEEKLNELRNEMFLEYSSNKQKYLNALEVATEFTENTKVVSFLLMLGSFVFLYNIDIDIHSKIIAGICFAFATMLHHLYKESLKEKYTELKEKISMLSYYIENIDEYKTVTETGEPEYSIHIEEVNNKGMTLRKLKKLRNKKDVL